MTWINFSPELGIIDKFYKLSLIPMVITNSIQNIEKF